MQMSDYHKGSSSSSNTYHPAYLLYIRFHSDDNISEIWALLVIEVKVKGFEVRSRWIILINIWLEKLNHHKSKQDSQSEDIQLDTKMNFLWYLGVYVHLEEVLEPVIDNVIGVSVHLTQLKHFSINQTWTKLHSCTQKISQITPWRGPRTCCWC